MQFSVSRRHTHPICLFTLREWTHKSAARWKWYFQRRWAFCSTISLSSTRSSLGVVATFQNFHNMSQSLLALRWRQVFFVPAAKCQEWLWAGTTTAFWFWIATERLHSLWCTQLCKVTTSSPPPLHPGTNPDPSNEDTQYIPRSTGVVANTRTTWRPRPDQSS